MIATTQINTEISALIAGLVFELLSFRFVGYFFRK